MSDGLNDAKRENVLTGLGKAYRVGDYDCLNCLVRPCQCRHNAKDVRLLRVELEETLKYVPHVDDVVQLRNALVKLAISPPESIETLGAMWLSYVRKVLVAVTGRG